MLSQGRCQNCAGERVPQGPMEVSVIVCGDFSVIFFCRLKVLVIMVISIS